VTAARAALASVIVSLAVLAPLAGRAAAAESRLRVLIVVDESDDPFAERLKAEVSALGLEVVAVEPWRTGEAVESLDAAGRANQAAAAIRMVASRKGVEVWVANQPTGRSLLRQLIVDERPGTPNEGLVALQTAELLRTTLLSRADGPAPAANPPPCVENKPAEIGPPAPPSPGYTGVQAAVGALWAPGVDNSSRQLWGTLSRVIVQPFGIALDLSVPWQRSTISGPEGSAEVRALLAGAALFVRYERPATGLYAMGAAGAAALWLTVDGRASPPLVASTHSVLAGAGYVRADGGFEVTHWLRFGLRLVAGAIPSGVAVKFAGNDAGTWGRPFVAGFAVVDGSW
jgi:hypothetical protein